MLLEKRNREFLLLLLSVSVLLIYGCLGDDEDCPTCPGGGNPRVPDPTLDNIWPSEDSTAWTYQYTLRMWGGDPFIYYASEDDVPEIPTMSEIEDLLRNQPVGDSVETGEAIYRLQFDGDTTTMSGAVGQNLAATIYIEEDETLSSIEIEMEKVFLTRLLIARPDLAEKISHVYDFEPEIHKLFSEHNWAYKKIFDVYEAILGRPLILHGYAWEKTEQWIGTYGDLDQLLAWKYLESNLNVSHEFTHQLIPSLASDVFLHCRILRNLSVETGVGTFEKAIECLYVIDYGIFEAWDAYNQLLGYGRFFDYGSIIYAPTIGPVFSYERSLCEPGDPPTLGIGDKTLSLIGTSAGVD